MGVPQRGKRNVISTVYTHLVCRAINNCISNGALSYLGWDVIFVFIVLLWAAGGVPSIETVSHKDLKKVQINIIRESDG